MIYKLPKGGWGGGGGKGGLEEVGGGAGEGGRGCPIKWTSDCIIRARASPTCAIYTNHLDHQSVPAGCQTSETIRGGGVGRGVGGGNLRALKAN